MSRTLRKTMLACVVQPASQSVHGRLGPTHRKSAGVPPSGYSRSAAGNAPYLGGRERYGLGFGKLGAQPDAAGSQDR